MNLPARIWKRWRYGTRWWIRWITYFVVAVVSFYAVEDTRGWFALKKAKAAYLATGRSLDINEILGPMPPDEDNFGAVDFIVELYESKQNTNHFPGFENLPTLWIPDLPPTRRTGLRMPSPLPKHFVLKGVTSSSQIGKELLKKLSPYSSAMEKIEQAANRPECRYPGTLNWSNKVYHLGFIQKAIQNFQYRAAGNHLARNFDQSLSDIITSGRLVDHLGRNQSLVGAGISIVMKDVDVNTISYLLGNQGWNEEQLKALKSEIEKRPTAAEVLERGWDIEIAVFVTEFDRINHNRFKAVKLYTSTAYYTDFRLLPPHTGLDFLEPLLVKGLIFFVPRGWWWQNEAVYLKAASRKPFSLPNSIPYTFLVSITTRGIPSLELKNKALESDITTQLAIFAIDLERHKLTHGSYPDDLSGFDIPSEKYGYQLGKNGRPIIFFDESATRPRPIPEADFDFWKHAHLWRYP